MNFRLAKKEEKDIILRLYESVKKNEYCAWDDEYPSQIDIIEDLSNNNLFVLDNGNDVIGAISIVSNNELDCWNGWKIGGKACEFARVVISPKYQGKGLSKELVYGVLDEIKKREYDTVHISVAKRNIPANRLYKSIGFDFVVEEYLYGEDFWLCEMNLSEKK